MLATAEKTNLSEEACTDQAHEVVQAVGAQKLEEDPGNWHEEDCIGVESGLESAQWNTVAKTKKYVNARLQQDFDPDGWKTTKCTLEER